MKKYTTRVIFRKWRYDCSVIAWLLDVPANPGYVMAYEHAGQHGEGRFPADTTPATPCEYAKLKAELEGRGYDLKVRERYTRK